MNVLIWEENPKSIGAMSFEKAMLASENRSNMFEVTINNDLSKEEAQTLVEKGRYDAVALVPDNFSISSNIGNIEVLADPTKSQQMRSRVFEGIKSVVTELRGGDPPVEASQAYGDLEYMDFLAPAIIVLTIFFGAGQGTGRALAGEKEEGTMDRLAMTPASSNDIIAGKTAYSVAVQLIRAFIIIFAISFIFNVAMNGSWLLVGLIVVLITVASVGIGLALSAAAEDESTYGEISMMVILPAMFVSGVFFPVSAMPSYVQFIAYIYPLTYANNAIRQVMLVGTGLGGIIHNLLILAGFAVGLYALGVWLFNRTARN